MSAKKKPDNKNGENEEKRWSSDLKWIIPNSIQIIIAFFILLSVCKTGENIKQQGEFNRDILRPFLYSVPKIKLSKSLDSLYVFCQLENCGETAALKVLHWWELTEDTDAFPVDSLRERIGRELKKDPIPAFSYVLPGKSLTTLEKPFALVKVKLNDTQKQVIEEEHKYFLHCYMEYCDFNNNAFYTRFTYLPDFRRGILIPINHSIEPIEHTPSYIDLIKAKE
jgi:hypothetical protein